jgi:hypothetical protein
MPTEVGRRSGSKLKAQLHVVMAHGDGRPYISGVFARRERAQAYLLEIPDGVRAQHKVTSVDRGFPLFVLEDYRGFRFFGSGEILQAVSAYRHEGDRADGDYEHAILYCFKRGYLPKVPGADEMGSARHWHITNENARAG